MTNFQCRNLQKQWTPIVLALSLMLAGFSICSADYVSGELSPDEISSISSHSGLENFGRDLGRNSLGLFLSNNLKPLLFLGVATSATFALDQETREAFENTNRSDAFSNIGDQLGKPYTIGASLGALYLVGLSTDNQKLKSLTYDLAQGYIIETALVMPLKIAVGRKRPDGSNNRSFPSGHSATAFLWATVLNHHYGPKVGIPAYLGATYIAASRITKDVHFLSDVVAGAGIGYLIARTVTRNRPKEPKLLWMPTITRLPRGGMNLEITILF